MNSIIEYLGISPMLVALSLIIYQCLLWLYNYLFGFFIFSHFLEIIARYYLQSFFFHFNLKKIFKNHFT